MSPDQRIELLGLSSEMCTALNICGLLPFAQELSQLDCVTQKSMIEYIYISRYIDN